MDREPALIQNSQERQASRTRRRQGGPIRRRQTLRIRSKEALVCDNDHETISVRNRVVR